MENMYPTEVIRLPSYGKFYPEGHPLRENGGKLEIKYMTAKEEDILTNTNLMRNGQTLDKLIESLVVHKGVNYKDLTASDISAILMFSRVISYGKDYEIQLNCANCGSEVVSIVDLSQLEAPDEGDVIDTNSDGTITFDIPTGRSVTIRVLTRADEIQIERDVESAASKNLDLNLVTSRLKKIVVELDGVTDKSQLSKMVDNMVVADTREIRRMYDKMTPMVNNYIETECSNCGQIAGGSLPITAKFFWPDI